MSHPAFLTPRWPAPANVRAVSSTRAGGVSAAPYDTFNLAAHVGDDAGGVRENRRILRESLQLPREPCWLEQVHGNKVVEAGQWSSPQRADACIACAPSDVCAVLTADCLPVLFCSRNGDRVAVAHAGWRGLASGVLDNTVAALKVSPRELIVWLGPAIGVTAFEVGDDVRDAFLARDSHAAQCFERNERGRWQCDLYGLARRNLQALGVNEAAISGGEFCTYSDKKRFYSYRRDGQCGRMATLIWLSNS